MTSNSDQNQGASLFHTPNPEELQRDIQNHSPEERAGQTREASQVDGDETIQEQEDISTSDDESMIGSDRSSLIDRQIRIASMGGQ